jgi:spermidine synthase
MPRMESRPGRPEWPRRKTPAGQRAVAPRVTLSEADGVRYLHFGSEWIQGAMRLARPFALELEYQAQMMAPVLIRPQPLHIVQLGLGAGALAKYCRRDLPQARLTVVELSADVVAVARRWFRLPPDDAQLQVLVADARAWLEDRRHARSADWLQVDLYDAAARGPVYDTPGFYRSCRAVLRSDGGVLAVNLFGRACAGSVAAIGEAFGPERVRTLPETASGNRIALALTGRRPWPRRDLLEADARAAEETYRLPLRRWAAALG